MHFGPTNTTCSIQLVERDFWKEMHVSYAIPLFQDSFSSANFDFHKELPWAQGHVGICAQR
jgi:hypothetical protein